MRDPDREQWNTFIQERTEEGLSRPGKRGSKPKPGLLDFHLARLRKAKRLLNRALKEIETQERELVKLRKEERDGALV